jgi:hypothetical protein
MPYVYLDKTDRDRLVAEAIKRLEPFADVKETEQRIVVSNMPSLRIARSRLDALLDPPLTDEEWRSKFRRSVGEVARYDDQEFFVEDEPPGDY